MRASQQILSIPRVLSAITQGNHHFYFHAVLYLALGFSLLGLMTLAFISYEEPLQKMALDSLFPASWHWAVGRASHFIFDSQTKIVIVGMISSGTLVITSSVLLPLKEYCSAIFEASQYPDT